MAGIIAVYALVVAVLIAGNIRPPPEKSYSLYEGFMHLACGLSVGLTGLAAGYAIGIVGDMVWSTNPAHSSIYSLYPGRAILHAAIQNLRWNGLDPHFRRSTWSLRVRMPFSNVAN